MNNKPECSLFDPAEIACEEISNANALVKEPLVSAFMVTYNHAPYIAQAIQGVLQQETSFPFELIIGEDCSTDCTRQIVIKYQKKHPDIIRVITSEQNVGMMKNGRRTEKACRGKYIAFCDGDDYWHHPKKLQIQVEYLEAHPDVGLVHSDYDKLINKTGKIIGSTHKQNNVKIPADNFFEELLVYNFIGELTVCTRSKLQKQATINNCRHYGMIGDLPLWMEISRHSKIGYIDESLAVHRILEESASMSKDIKKRFDFAKYSYAVRSNFIEKYGCSEKTKNIVLRDYHRMILHYSSLLLDEKNARKSFEFLKTVENDREQRAISYCYYFASRNRLNWLVIRALLGIKSLLPRRLRPRRNR